MSNTIIAIRKSMVMLFSFALIAGMLTMINVGVNESGNSFTSVTAAHAASVNDGSITLVAGDTGNAITVPSNSGGCRGTCGSASGTGGSSGGGSVGISDPNVKSVFYDCSSMSGNGNCNVNAVTVRDARIVWTTTQCSLKEWGTVVAYGGDAAVQYLKDYAIGAVWVPWNDEEKVFSFITGYDLGWFAYPTDWSGVSSYYYNGTTNNYPTDRFDWECYPVQHVTPAYASKNTVCVPMKDGRPFPYSVGYSVTYRNVNSSGGKGFDWRIINETCVYVSPNTPPPSYPLRADTCFWNIGYNGNYSTNKNAIAAGGVPTSVAPRALNAPAIKPTVVGSNENSQLVNCTNILSMNASLSLRDGYAYYRLTGNAQKQTYEYYYWDTGYTNGRQLLARIVPVGVPSGATKSVYGTFTCQNSPPYRQYGTWNSLPNLTFSYSGCGQNTTWSCLIPNSPQINNTSNQVELMRDGNYIPTNLQGVSVSGNGIRDSSTGQVGTVADGNMSYKVQVVNGSSPFNGTNANDSKQYFQLWNSSKSHTLSWDTWNTNPNANKNAFLNFYWSSDNGSNWQMNYQAKINTAQFAVPWQDSSTSAPTTKWMTDNNVACGTKNSNKATILRSVSSNGG